MTVNELLLTALVYVCICVFTYNPQEVVDICDNLPEFTLLVQPMYTWKVTEEGEVVSVDGDEHDCFLEYKDLMSASIRELKTYAKNNKLTGYSYLRKDQLKSLLLSY